MRKYLIADGEFYAVYVHVFGCLILERKNDNVNLLLQGDDAHYFHDELVYIDEIYGDPYELGCQVDILCSDYDEMMCVPVISRAERGIEGWSRRQVA